MTGRPKKRRWLRGQGMTEYIILVGLVALLMIAAVKRFGFSVNEAIQGSTFAGNDMYPPDPGLPNGHVDNGGAAIGRTSRTNKQVYRIKDGDRWTYHTGATLSSPVVVTATDGTIGPL